MSDSTLRDPERLQQYVSYLRILARTQMPPSYTAKAGASDVVQQTMLQAVRAIDDFRGSTEAELRGWLRQILARNLAHLGRDLHRDKRDIRRERSIEQKLGQSSMRLEQLLAADDATPSQIVATRENFAQLIDGLQQLSEAQAAAIRLHYLEDKPISEVAAALGKSNAAVAGLLHRGLKGLRRAVQAAEPEEPA